MEIIFKSFGSPSRKLYQKEKENKEAIEKLIAFHENAKIYPSRFAVTRVGHSLKPPNSFTSKKTELKTLRKSCDLLKSK